MSKLTPEVGDVWVEEDSEHDYKRCVWISLVKDTMVSGITDEGRCLWCASIEEFLTKHKFLFKSKCNVNNLFEVQDD
ncbi:MAG: hypothetical protein KHX55_02290 [Proteobacteria bacterium]|nr:hypothetical protein [Pseudomonadota bacterium]